MTQSEKYLAGGCNSCVSRVVRFFRVIIALTKGVPWLCPQIACLAAAMTKCKWHWLNVMRESFRRHGAKSKAVADVDLYYGDLQSQRNLKLDHMDKCHPRGGLHLFVLSKSTWIILWLRPPPARMGRRSRSPPRSDDNRRSSRYESRRERDEKDRRSRSRSRERSRDGDRKSHRQKRGRSRSQENDSKEKRYALVPQATFQLTLIIDESERSQKKEKQERPRRRGLRRRRNFVV